MKLLVVDDIHSVFLEKTRQAGFVVDYFPELDRTGTEEIIGDYQGLVIRSKFAVDAAFMDKAFDLKVIARAGAGLDNVDDLTAAKRGIALLNAPEGNRQAVAEHMLGMLLSLLNHLHVAHGEIRDHHWLREENRGLQLSGRTIGLIGFGNNGQAIARCFSGFDVKVLAYDKYHADFDSPYARSVSLDELKAKADVLSLHIPLTMETRGWIDQGFIDSFQKPFVFLNGARGEIVHLPAILQGLRSGKIMGAAFDVLPTEKFPALGEETWFEELANHPQVLLSPHVAGWTVESYHDIASVLADKLIALLV